ncbi:MAG: MFS transporter [Mycobacterium sp.]
MAGFDSAGVVECRRYGKVPFAAGLGYSMGVIHVYCLGVFMEPLQNEFGWSRAEASVGLTIVGIAAAVAALPIGLTVDRLGPRRVGLVGVTLMAAAFALLGSATGSMTNWLLLWGVLAFASFWVQTTVWTSAVASRFETSRGLALAVTLSGGSLAAAVFPPLATVSSANGVGAERSSASVCCGGCWSPPSCGCSSAARRMTRLGRPPAASDPRTRGGRPARADAGRGPAPGDVLQAADSGRPVRLHHTGCGGAPRADPAGCGCRPAGGCRRRLAGGRLLDRRSVGHRCALGPVLGPGRRRLRLSGAHRGRRPAAVRRCQPGESDRRRAAVRSHPRRRGRCHRLSRLTALRAQELRRALRRSGRGAVVGHRVRPVGVRRDFRSFRRIFELPDPHHDP